MPFYKGKSRARFNGHAYTPKKTKELMDQIRSEWESHGHPKAPKGTPVTVFISCSRPMPRSRWKRGLFEEYDVFVPDVDNIAKLVLDGLNGVAWEDDRQIVGITVVKRPRKRDAKEQTYVCVSWEKGE